MCFTITTEGMEKKVYNEGTQRWHRVSQKERFFHEKDTEKMDKVESNELPLIHILYKHKDEIIHCN